MQTEILKVPGMTTQAGADAIGASLGKLAGVASVSISLAGQRATVLFDEAKANRAGLDAAVAQAGFAVAAPAAGACCGGCGG